MSIKPITKDEVLETLTEEERAEVEREDFLIPMEFYLEGINIHPQTNEEMRENAILKLR